MILRFIGLYCTNRGVNSRADANFHNKETSVICTHV